MTIVECFLRVSRKKIARTTIDIQKDFARCTAGEIDRALEEQHPYFHQIASGRYSTRERENNGKSHTNSTSARRANCRPG